MRMGWLVNEVVEKYGEVCSGTSEGNPYIRLKNCSKHLFLGFLFGLQECKCKLDFEHLMGT